MLHCPRNGLQWRLYPLPSTAPSAVAAPIDDSDRPGSCASTSPPAFTAPVPFAAAAVSKPAPPATTYAKSWTGSLPPPTRPYCRTASASITRH